jgi:hypothetical protein
MGSLQDGPREGRVQGGRDGGPETAYENANARSLWLLQP